MSDWIRDVGDADFEREVLERSDERPVVVDFWAPWCAPCRQLGPILERLAEEHAGAFVLAKVNVDEAPGLAQAFQVRGIPAVKAIRERALAGAFEGLQPESVVRRFVESLLPGEADLLAADGEERAAAGDAAGAEHAFQEALARDPRQARALLGLARARAQAGDADAALGLLERIGPGTRYTEEADRIAALLRTRVGGAQGDEDELRARVAAEPSAPGPRLALGRLLAARGRHPEALAELLEAVRLDPGFGDGAARLAMLDLFTALGPEHPLTQEYRSALARTLFR
jgi:putative thioredoxin